MVEPCLRGSGAIGADQDRLPVPVGVGDLRQPEVCARAIVHVAENPRRSMWVGASTFATILGNRVAPAFMDWYLARTNVQGQQSRRHDPPSEDVNLWRPVSGDTGRDHGSGGTGVRLPADHRDRLEPSTSLPPPLLQRLGHGQVESLVRRPGRLGHVELDVPERRRRQDRRRGRPHAISSPRRAVGCSSLVRASNSVPVVPGIH